MEKDLEKMMLTLRRFHPEAEVAIIGQVFELIKKEIELLTPPRPRDIMNRTLRVVQRYSIRPIKPALIAVFVLHDVFEHHPERVHEWLKTLPEHITHLFNAHRIAKEHLKSTMYNRDIYEHSLQTVLQLAELQLGYQTLCAAFLQHVPACSWFNLKNIKEMFGEEIHDIVHQVNMLTITPITKKKNIAAVRHLFLASAKELRAVIIKIAEQIDFLKHIDHLPTPQQQQRAIEAMYIYAPIAELLGIWELKWQLEDYAFKHLDPRNYGKIEKRFHIDEKQNRNKYIEKTKKLLLAETKKYGFAPEVTGRLKHFYSIHQKMQDKKKAFNEIYDVFALSVVVPTIDDCYRMLGIIHNIWKPKPRRVKDYIASPKSNNYRSLHTTVYGLNNRMTEFQIRTPDMEAESRFGIAAHWHYKNRNASEVAPEWIQKLLDEHQTAHSDTEFFERVNTDMIIDKMYVYTPKGDVVALPKAATPIDFAYHIHHDIGNRAAGALVNGVNVPLDTRLNNEDSVEIIVDNNQTYPKPAWLQFVKSDVAKRAISGELEKMLGNHGNNQAT